MIPKIQDSFRNTFTQGRFITQEITFLYIIYKLTFHSTLHPPEPTNFIIERFTSCGWNHKKTIEWKLLDLNSCYHNPQRDLYLEIEIEIEPYIFTLHNLTPTLISIHSHKQNDKIIFFFLLFSSLNLIYRY